MEDVFASASQSRNEDEEALTLSAIQKLPTYTRLRTGLLNSLVENKNQQCKLVDVRNFDDVNDRNQFIERNFKVPEQDNDTFLTKLRARIDMVGIQLPKVEVRFEQLKIEADCYVGTRALPTLLNTSRNILESAVGLCGIRLAQRTNYTILKDVSGIIKPSRMTLLLGPPSSGKTTLCLALAGKLDPTLKVQGQISYNGHQLDEFEPRKTSAYVSQNDVHLGDLTVKETFDYSARFQGVGHRYDLLTELDRKEKEAGIAPDADVDLFMKATAMEEAKSNLIVDYTLKLLGLDICKDTVVGDEMRRGISGGQKKRVTTGEMIVGPTKTLFMDEISTGLDSSTTHQIVKCMQQIVHLTDATVLMSLLQPDPETFDLFDDIILLSEGQIVYQGPREHVLAFFESCGFKCPQRKGTADFLQEVTSKKDQEQYWADDKLSMAIKRLPVFYKHRDLLFYPPWAFTIPNFLLRVPFSVFCSIIWTLVTYWTIGFAPESSRFFKHLLVILLIQQMAAGLFRLMSGVCRTMIIAHTGGALSLLILFLLGGFMLPKGRIPVWWTWAHWISPLSYSFKALTVNEMLSPRWMNRMAADNVTKLGASVLETFGVEQNEDWYWIGVAALLGFTILFNVLFTFSLMYLNPLGKPQAIISEEVADEQSEKEGSQEKELKTKISPTNGNGASEILSGHSTEAKNGVSPKRGMVLPFPPLSMSFDSVNYYVDMPSEMKCQGVTEDRLQLLKEVTGAFRPGILTALMGVSGAGKTTLMDVLAGRKTGGYVEGDIRISGFPKNQETFARISGYCEQTDIHSPQVTVRESLIYSAFLRLPKEVSDKEKMVFVEEVMELVELTNLRHALVGLPGITGLSTEQRKRLTIAVELVANPSIIFMDEPTSGLDARAAAIVMRTVRNTVDTGRTVVCTIHQPSIDIFEAFDELVLMKRGGQLIYSGPLGQHSHKVIEYFEAIPGVPRIKERQNPAAWMLEASSSATEVRLQLDFAEHYRSSALYQQTKAAVEELRTPPTGATDLYFPSQYSQSTWGQFKLCLWKQWWTYWRSPNYNLVRFFFSLVSAILLGTIFWQVGIKREDTTDLAMIIGAMYVSVMFVGINNCNTVQPVVAVERTVFYRERAAGMYSALPYAMAQVFVEIPYVFIQTTYYSLIVYSMVSFQWTLAKFFWFFFITFFSFLYFTYYGMMTVSITPNQEAAAIFAAAFFALFTLFSGFFIPKPRIPKWWIWYYYICPVAWTVYGLIVTQYGDIEDTIKVNGIEPDPSIKWYVQNHFGYDLNFMGPTAAILVAFCAFFALVFAFCIKKLNFQTR
ncbi:hypothetical protein JCGZ_24863 [Jatropha curcas]|uniref:ABC transporter domain-containing protein n=1 Tax=Jatropha curcas TaxID=180498 RepID=A0A067L9S8_JATCU|nr:hypothetical protein JCGZ_24863 [Jatropha curcas]